MRVLLEKSGQWDAQFSFRIYHRSSMPRPVTRQANGVAGFVIEQQKATDPVRGERVKLPLWRSGLPGPPFVRLYPNRDAVACNTKRREMSADRVGDLAGRKVRVVLLRHRVSAWPSCSAITLIGTPRMASVEP
jgi:hypothetical protein